MIVLTWNPPNNGTPIVFSSAATDYRLLLRSSGFAAIPAEHTYAEKAPARHGRVRKYTALKERLVSFDIRIQGTDLDDLQTKSEALASALNPLDGPGVLQFTRENGSVVYLNCIGVEGNPALSETEKTSTSWDATIKLVADEDPFWHAGVPKIEYFDPNPANFFPFPSGTGTWPFTLSSKNKTKNMTNDGSVEVPVIITFTGPMVNPSISRTYTKAGAEITDTFTAIITLAANDRLIINTHPDIMTARYYPAAGGDLNAHKYITGSKFWQMMRGSNTVTLLPSSSSSGSLASVLLSELYVGV